MADPMSERHWLAIKRYVTNVRATYRDLRYAGRPMQHLVPLWDEAERLRAALDETTAARDGDLVRQLAEAWRERDAARAEAKRLRAVVAGLREQLERVRRAGEEELEYAAQRYAMADAMRGDACIERDRLAAQVKRTREELLAEEARLLDARAYLTPQRKRIVDDAARRLRALADSLTRTEAGQ